VGGKAFTIKRFVFQGLCEKAAPVISSGDTGIMRCFLVDVSPQSITVTGSDIELVIQASSTAVSSTESMTLALPAKRLLDMIKNAPEGDVTVTAEGAFATVAVGGVSWKLRLENAADFTLPAKVDESALEAANREGFLAALKVVKHAISRDGGRPPLMMVDVMDNSVTASDGSRLQRVMLEFPADMKIPAAAVDHLIRIMNASEAKEILAAEQEGDLVFRVGSATFMTRKTQARFPDMESQILKPAAGNQCLLVFDRRAMLEAVKRVQITADAETSAIGWRLSKDKVTVLSKDKDGNEATQDVACWWKESDRLVVLNHVFLAEMLAVWPSESCRFWLGTEGTKKKSMLMLSDKKDGAPATQIGVIQQLHAALLGYA
jgi:DNA polymerase-3 subunit beta